jgi:hypothetical protein
MLAYFEQPEVHAKIV